ncbi:hydroxyacid dehydrogenase, partial [Candidatus Daviesbacteria bacterium]|nr:hydroxyacid dehydrogenase [Candidatus Daviesbacteria bacterium]
LSKKLDFAYVGLEELLKSSDIITLHVPALPTTVHMINEETISHFKKGAVLINTSRGNIIKTKVLVKALEDGIISQAALDVLEEEGELTNATEDDSRIEVLNHKLMKMDNVLITPHTAFQTKEAEQRILQTTVENVKSFLEGSPQNIVKS